MNGPGTLYVVGTPIGNLSDLTFRALETLKSVDAIACEDTRHTLKLLNHYGISKPLHSLFGPKEKRETPRILNLLKSGKSVAMVSDAGTPAISDPGNHLVRSVRESGFKIEPVPGISALSCAMSVSGCADEGFVFLGFLQRKSGKIKKELARAKEMNLPVVFYESPYRVVKTLELAATVFGSNSACWIGREMTKKYEEYMQGTIEEISKELGSREVLGELTVILKNPEAAS